MSDNFEDLSSRMPDMAAVLAQRIAAAKGETTPAKPGAIDPYQMMVNKKKGVEPDPEPVQKWPEEDISKLQAYCQKMGIVGFNCGKMHPIAALAMLKSKFGDDFSNTPLQDRVPEGYEKIGTKPKHGPNYPYESAIKNKGLLLG